MKKLTKAQEKKLDALYWRIRNTFVAVILPVALPIIYVALQDTPDDVAILANIELWESVLYAVLIALLGSAIAGVNKVRRM